MTRQIISIIELLFYDIIIILFFNRILNKKINLIVGITSIILSCGILLFAACVIDYLYFLAIYAFIQAIQIVILKFTISRAKIWHILGLYTLILSINSILSISVKAVIYIYSVTLSYHTEFLIHIIVLTAIAILCFIPQPRISIGKTLLVLPPKIKIITILAFSLGSLIITMMISNPLLEENSPWSIALRLSIVLLALFLCVTFPIVILIAMANAYLKKENENYEERLEAQADYYTQLSRSNFEMRRFRHDFKNMQIGLRTYIEANDLPSAIAVLDGEQENLQSATDIITYDTGNGIVDAILMDKQQKAADKNIKIEFTGTIPMTALSAVDLCVIFGNTLDNALEACEKLPPDETKTISISSLCNSGFMFITITNPVLENVTIKGNTVETTKNDRNLHGYGLYSLTRAVKKYDGDVKLKSENNTFTVEIELTLI